MAMPAAIAGGAPEKDWVIVTRGLKREYDMGGEIVRALGGVDLRAVLSALRETGFAGPMRPDHGRMIWGETGQPGYGLHDRALGAMFLCYAVALTCGQALQVAGDDGNGSYTTGWESIANLCVDVAYAFLDPRVRYQ